MLSTGIWFWALVWFVVAVLVLIGIDSYQNRPDPPPDRDSPDFAEQLEKWLEDN